MAFNIDRWLQENPYGGKKPPVQQSQPNPSSPSFDIEQFLKDNPFRADNPTSGDTRNIVAPASVMGLEGIQKTNY